MCQILRFNFERSFKAKSNITCHYQRFEEFIAPKKTYGPPGGGDGASTKTKGAPALVGGKAKSLPTNFPNVIQKFADFMVDGAEVNAYGQHYISGSLLCNPEYEVRIYYQFGSSEWNSMLAMKEDTVFVGKILAYRNDEKFFTVQLNSITEADDPEEEDYSDTFLGFNNRLLTEEQFAQKTYRGCAWCTSKVTVLDAKHVHWISEDDFICPDCCEMDEVKEYIQES